MCTVEINYVVINHKKFIIIDTSNNLMNINTT